MIDDMNITIDDMNMNMNIVEDNMNMYMTFHGWKEYKLKIVFEGWNVTQLYQFILSCIAIILITILYKYIKYVIHNLEKQNSYIYKYNFNKLDNRNNELVKIKLNKKIKLTCIKTLNYGLSLMLILFSITYNPYIFSSLILGYGIGDFIFYIEN